MLPTYKDGSIVLVDKFSKTSAIQANDILIIDSVTADTIIIKRVIGLPGDTVQITDGIVYVNGSPFLEVIETELINDAGNAANAITLGTDEYFVLGDNRNSSIDSRFNEVGIIHTAEILGKVITFRN